ncbi:hypothetical protein [Ureibacillus manganicus]|uniref:Uncharacterized protein n=1 Tax=Ureibacillus manganicus DSM 26584 TaxID=1384049 RepID=A0A0A3I4Y1_9BACL|nr:hypothetical protein [Ureibacillus manganicus]KGR79846.1 hypothetical protein CD29_04770 [Ureibacillus manganicus DSM 26584]
MVRLKHIVSVLVAIVLCGVIWLVHPAKEQVNQLETQIGRQYYSANFLLLDTVEELLAWNFSQPLTDADVDYLDKLSDDLLHTTDLIFFGGNVVHHEWRSRMLEVQEHLTKYVNGTSLTEIEVADLMQTLKATRFITLDFQDYVENIHDFYNAMHDEQHEMFERVKERLATKY